MAASQSVRASATAPVNIAVVKYWGKRDTKLNLPTNSSASVTLSQLGMRAHTTASAVPSSPTISPTAIPSEPDCLILNGKSEQITGRTAACIAQLRSLRAEAESSDGSLARLAPSPLRIVSRNNFPTAAGLASSAAGFAALVKAIAQLYNLSADPTRLSIIARQGSGSACRSLFGGYVAWQMGSRPDGSDSLAVQLAPASHWPEMRALILVANAGKKQVGSTIGMQQTVETSQLFQHRISSVVDTHMKLMTTAIENRDFGSFAAVTMRDSNSFHAVCLDSVPPISYLTDPSRAAISAITALNAAEPEPIAAYTFDAGPNAVIYFLHQNRHRVLSYLSSALADVSGWTDAIEAARVDGGGIDGVPSDQTVDDSSVDPAATTGQLDESVKSCLAAGIRSVIYTAVGEGARGVDDHLDE